MWADAQRDGRPAEYRWRRLRKFRNSTPWTTPQSLADAGCWSAVHAVALLIYENARLGRKVNFARGEIPAGGKSPQNVYIYSVPAQRRANIVQSSVGLYGERRRCSNEAKTRKPLTFAGVSQTGKPISVVSGPKFAIL